MLIVRLLLGLMILVFGLNATMSWRSAQCRRLAARCC